MQITTTPIPLAIVMPQAGNRTPPVIAAVIDGLPLTSTILMGTIGLRIAGGDRRSVQAGFGYQFNHTCKVGPVMASFALAF